MDFTPEQTTVIDMAKNSKQSLLINALAGAAKTTTLVAAAHKLPLVPTFCGAFNKRIADEMSKRMPSHVTVQTMNAVGHRVWQQKLGRRPIIETDKGYNILAALAERAPDFQKKEFGESFASILRAVHLAKTAGYVPNEFSTVGQSLIYRNTFIDSIATQIDLEPNEFFLEMLEKALGQSIAQSFEGKIDFDDQIYMSTLFGGQYPKYEIVMVDEAQDLSALNHLSLSKMVGKRLIAVGDPNQAIYGFRGAHTSSMAVLKDDFNMTELELSVSFRCPRSVIRRQQARIPNMTWPEWAEEGKVEYLTELDLTSIPEGAAIICRNNAPLFSAALRLIRAGRSVKLLGADIGKALITLMSKFGGKEDLSQEALLVAIRRWEQEELNKARQSRKAAITDRAACMEVFAEAGATKSEALAFAKHILEASGSILLLTGHKAKGEEYDIVYHLEPRSIPSRWARESAEAGDESQMEQELNLRYVIETRTKKELYLIDLEDFG